MEIRSIPLSSRQLNLHFSMFGKKPKMSRQRRFLDENNDSADENDREDEKDDGKEDDDRNEEDDDRNEDDDGKEDDGQALDDAYYYPDEESEDEVVDDFYGQEF